MMKHIYDGARLLRKKSALIIKVMFCVFANMSCYILEYWHLALMTGQRIYIFEKDIFFKIIIYWFNTYFGS